MGRIREIAEATEQEVGEYLAHLGWDENPFARPAILEEYVLPSHEDVADIASHLQNYTGPVLIHSRYSGVGKTTLLSVLLEEYQDDYQTIYIGEHNVTPYELVSIVADKVGIGKSSSTKLTEQKIREHTSKYEITYLLGVDEFGLNDPDTLHTIQFLNDLEEFHVVLTGMTSQWDAIGQLGSDGRAFQRRVAYQLQLTPLSRDQVDELVQRRIATATGQQHENHNNISIAPFTTEAVDVIHEESDGVPAVFTAACAELVGLAAYQHSQGAGGEITADLARAIDYTDPEVE